MDKMKKILFILLLISSVSFAEGFVPSMKVGDKWTVRREISSIDNLSDNNKKIQYWKYEVINRFEFNEKEYIVIFALSADADENIKIVINTDKFVFKEINFISKGKITLIDMEEINAPVIDINILARVYDMPAFPLSDPESAGKNVEILPNGGKRIRINYRRRYTSRGEVASSELIWQETDNISKKDIIEYSRKSEDHMNKIQSDGYLINIKGEKRRIKQIWVESVPWWIYNESNNEKDYLVGYHTSVPKK